VSTNYSTLAYNNSTFVSKATLYSTAYRYYEAAEKLVSKKTTEVGEQRVKSEKLDVEWQTTYSILQEATSKWKEKSSELSTLNATSLRLGELLSSRKIEEAVATFNYTSTINTLSTLSTMYNAAVANNNYAIAVSTQSYIEKVYVDAMTT
jgi:hypothetical protein